MAETIRNKTDLLTIFPLNTTGVIDAQDERDFVASVVGALWTTIKTNGSPYTLLTDDVVVIVAEAANYIVNLPAVATSAKRVVYIKKKSTGAYTVTITASGAETIDGSVSQILTLQYASVMLVCDGTEWHIL